jgi:hypothetical protein
VKVPKVEKELTQAPSCPLYSSSTKVGAIQKHKEIPTSLKIAKVIILKRQKILINIKLLILLWKS